jgi:hypothetical protein
VPLPTTKLSEVNCRPDGGNYNCPIPWIGEYIVSIYNYGVGVAGILAAIVLMAGSINWPMDNVSKEMGTCHYIKEAEVKLAAGRYNNVAQSYRDATCASETDLTEGVEFYATGYYKPRWENTKNFWCVVAMQCSCPNGINHSETCDFLYGETFPGYHPCQYFSESTPYCNLTASGQAPQLGDIAGPGNCQDTLPYGTKVCFKGKTYTITDTGGGIKGKRIDIWSGDSLKDAYANTGMGILKKGACTSSN